MFPEEGKKAPVFTGVDQNGNKVSLKDYVGKKLAIYFYPEDGTPTCTVQACNLRDNFSALQKHGIEILGISPDAVAKHKKFEQKNQLPFTLLADPEKKIIDKYGVWAEKQMYGRKYMGVLRTTFLVNEKGVLVKIIAKPKSKEHAEEIIAAWP
jgi:thioredoxin-dependent peroxiredoxin